MKFKDAQSRMITYLSSSEFKTRSDAGDTLKSIPILKKIVKRRMITTNSQEGITSSGFNPVTNKHYKIKERAYVMGFMKQTESSLFVDWMNSHTDKLAFVIKGDSSKEFNDLFNGGNYIPNIVVTMDGGAVNKKMIKLSPVTRIHTVLPSRIIDMDKKLEAHLNKSENVDYVVCIDLVYGRKASNVNGLYGDVLKGLKEAL
jgi:hypothetical protein